MKYGIEQQIACVERELRYRRQLYPRRVAEGKLEQWAADKQIALMVAVLETLLAVKKATDPQQGLAL